MCKVFHVLPQDKMWCRTQNTLISLLQEMILGLGCFLKFEPCCRLVREDVIVELFRLSIC